MASDKSLWYRLGFALERARHAPPGEKRTLAGLAERRTPTARGRRSEPPAETSSVDDLLATGAVALALKALDAWRPRRKASLVGLVRAGAAGAAAALLVELVRPLLSGRAETPTFGPETADRVVEGAGQGLLYGALVEPRLPGPALLKGTLYGSAEYAVLPAGGLVRLLESHGPLHRLPFVATLLRGAGARDRPYLEHVAFGISLALLYRSSLSNNGIRLEPDE